MNWCCSELFIREQNISWIIFVFYNYISLLNILLLLSKWGLRIKKKVKPPKENWSLHHSLTPCEVIFKFRNSLLAIPRIRYPHSPHIWWIFNLLQYWILMFLKMDSLRKKNISMTFYIRDIFGVDEYFRIYSRKKNVKRAMLLD